MKFASYEQIEEHNARMTEIGARRAARAQRKVEAAARKALYAIKLKVWARHKGELVALKAKHAAELALLGS